MVCIRPVPDLANRGFVHTGSSDGHVNNDNLEWYHIPTIFNVLEDQGKSWGIFYNSEINSFTYLQFPYIGGLRDRFANIHSLLTSAKQQLTRIQV